MPGARFPAQSGSWMRIMMCESQFDTSTMATITTMITTRGSSRPG
ncbi:hypothetical protein L842_0444 [Mycobacterium intracellulare MIN_052511_1280]|nr:hypothetical protein L842_0444 [Mycobacterium intracellulare MIN_052511_1280]